jgi:hypothetical protein
MQYEEVCVVVQCDGAYDTTAKDDDDVCAGLFVSADILVDRNTFVFLK